jgi:patatin-related protein
MTTSASSGSAAEGLLIAGDAEVIELRIALVCYGGVSLAIYMHGITKELQALLRASRAFDQGRAPGGDTERAYFDQLSQLRDAGVRLSVTVDLIAGTSAGGINGVCLAKAIVKDADQTGLTNLWMNQGDIVRLMRLGRLGRRFGELATAAALPFRAKSVWSPLSGDKMCVWLYDALAGMDSHPGDGGLLPEGGTIDLYVTATDLRGTDQIVPLGTGGSLHDRTYHRVFAFHSDPSTAAVVAGLPRSTTGSVTIATDGGALAFAARATSSFPGAFPPISLKDFAAAVRDPNHTRAFDPKALALQLMPEYRLMPSQDPTTVYECDGGVLDNAPFDHIIDAIARQPAGRQVSRHLIYIEPDPGGDSPGATLSQLANRQNAKRDEQPPTWAAGVWAALLTIPHHQPLIGAIRDLAAINEDVATIGRITTALQDEVIEYLQTEAIDPANAARLNFAELKEYAVKVYATVPKVIGTLNNRTYGRLKMQAIAHRLAQDLANNLEYPPSSPQASFLRAALAAWLHDRPEWTGDDESRQLWLGPIDIPYRERRLEFIIAGINALFDATTARQVAARDVAVSGGPTRDQLAAIKQQAWGLLLDERGKPARAISAAASHAAFAAAEALGETVLTADPAFWAREHSSDIQILVDAYTDQIGELTSNSAELLWRAFQEATNNWSNPEASNQLVGRYIGFPLWDALLFPVQALARLPLLNPVRASRFSPRDAGALKPPPKMKDKLEGVATHHFGAFFELERRQNDYLWGRLDAAELILKLLRDHHEYHRPQGVPALASGDQHLNAALNAILDSEENQLDKIGSHIALLRKQLKEQPN